MKYTGLVLALASTALGQTLQQVLANNTQLTSLAALLNSTGTQLPPLTNNTLLAPSNAAIAAFLNSSTAGALASDPALVSAILSYHVLQGNYSTIANTSFLPTLLMPPTYANVTGGQRVEALPSGGNVTFYSGLLQNSSVVNNSIPFNGGTIHIINRFLTIPQNVSTTAVALNLTSAAGALIARNLATTLDHSQDVTIFVPNNAAFQAIGSVLANASTATLDSVLTYHVHQGAVIYSPSIVNGSTINTLQGGNLTFRVSNGSVYVNNAKVIRPNVLISGGVIHVIDAVLNPGNATALPNTNGTAVAFGGAASASNVPFTSGVPTPTSAINTAAATTAATAKSSSSSGIAARPMETAGFALAALFGGAAAIMNM